MTLPNRNVLWARAIAQELVRSGVTNVCFSPGSRSAPLALAFADERAVRLFCHLDERSSGFFALGLARASRRPAAIVCTSGTAAANLLPALVEAAQSRIPLVVLTADRPAELRDWSAPQTIDQVRLYGSYARWSVDLPAPEPTAAALGYLRQTVCRAVAVAEGVPKGPVHLNVPFREPLTPAEVPGDVPADLPADLADGRPNGEPFLRLAPASPAPEEDLLRQIARRLAEEPSGLVVAGPHELPAGVARAARALAGACGYPLLADAASSMRFSLPEPHGTVAHADLLLRSDAFAGTHRPRAVLRLWGTVTSKFVASHIDGAAWTAIFDDGAYPDPSHRARVLVRGETETALRRLAGFVADARVEHPTDWAQSWRDADRVAGRALAEALGAEEAPSEPAAVAELCAEMPGGTTLFVANSMPLRDLEAVAPATERPIRVLSNRGASGIDGTASTALGIAAASAGPTVLLTGDLAFLHDLNGLWAARRHGLSLTVLLLNNDGGGIFSFLDIADYPARFEELFGTPHGIDFAPAVQMYGGRFTRAKSREELRTALREAFVAPGLSVVEVRTARSDNVAVHRRLFADVVRRLEEEET